MHGHLGIKENLYSMSIYMERPIDHIIVKYRLDSKVWRCIGLRTLLYPAYAVFLRTMKIYLQESNLGSLNVKSIQIQAFMGIGAQEFIL
jgi:hypothetical protein